MFNSYWSSDLGSNEIVFFVLTVPTIGHLDKEQEEQKKEEMEEEK